jgi:hypothetical protein
MVVTEAYSFDPEAKLNFGPIFMNAGARLILREYSKLRDTTPNVDVKRMVNLSDILDGILLIVLRYASDIVEIHSPRG